MDKIEKAIEKYDEFKHLLLANGFTVEKYKQINYGLQFPVQRSNWSGIVRIYQNNKGVVKTDLSQLDESEHSQLIRSFCEDRGVSKVKEIESTLSDVLTFPMMGSDESGKGDYFGSLVIACVYVDENIEAQLSSLGVKDSKALSDTKIVKIAREIRKICVGKFVVVEISPEKYNQIYAKFEHEKKSLNDLLAWAHAKAIEELLLKVECKTVIVDRFANEQILLTSLQEEGKKLSVIQTPRAERYMAVAAASILARDRFVNKLDKLGKQYEVILPKGASNAVIETARQLVGTHGSEILEKVAKVHFKTTQEL
jgi:ribonuclease HIII